MSLNLNLKVNLKFSENAVNTMTGKERFSNNRT